jgi:hypothetical protein
MQRSLHMATAVGPDRRSGAQRTRDWLSGAFGLRGPEPAVTGDAARIPWTRRLRSAVLLLVLLVLLGTGLAASIGVLVFVAGFLLELATT